MKKIIHSLLLLAVCVPMAQAAPPTPWDSIAQDSVAGSTTVTMKDGKKHRGKSAKFTASDVKLDPSGESFSRDDVKEVVIRANRDPCCSALFLPLIPAAIALSPDPGDGVAATIGVAIIMVPVEAVCIVIAPPIAAVQAIKRLKPAKILYKIAP
jgi:hypothetical protein